MSECGKRPGPPAYHRRPRFRLWLATTFLFLYAPIVILVAFSFDDSKRNIVWRGFSTKYCRKALANSPLVEAFTNSLVITLTTAAISTVLDGFTALALWRFRFPFVGILVQACLAGFDPSLAETSKDLGASDWQTPKNIIKPHMKPRLIAGALLAMAPSLNDVAITFFTSEPEPQTFPAKAYSIVRLRVTHEAEAASIILILITIVLTIMTMRL